MNVLLDPPSTVLIAYARETDGEEPARAGTDEFATEADLKAMLTEYLERGTADAVRTAHSPDEVVSDLERNDDVGCVVIVGYEDATDGAKIGRAVRDFDEDLPVVAYDHGSRPDTVLPRARTPGELRSVVDDALATYRRRRVEAEESDMLTAMLADLGKAIYFKDDDGRILHMADVGGGPDPEEARGKTDLEIFGPESMPELAFKDDMRVIEEGAILDREERVPNHDSWMQTTKVPWTDDDGDIRGLIGHTIDVTQRKRMEHSLDELRHRFTTFTSQLRHELKTQLQIAMGSLPATEEDRLESTEQLERAIDRMDRIVEDYDRLARRSITVGDESKPTRLVEAAEDAWEAVDDAGYAVDIVVDEEVCVNAPNGLVRSVLENLLRDLTARADDDATIRVGTTDTGFYVEDTSRDVPESKRSVIEQPGYAAAQDGSGRELSVVKDEMEKHVWSLSLGESPDGGGRLVVENCLVDDDTEPVERDDEEPWDPDSDVVGTLRCDGTVDHDEELDRWYVEADGSDVFRQDNDFFFVYTSLEGDVSIQGKVIDVEHVMDLSKAGFMIRGSLDENACYGYLGKTPAHGSEVLWRTERRTDGRSRQLDEEAVMFDWYRVDRVGEEVRMYVSMDGRHWQEIDRRPFPVDGTVHAGLVVCSLRPGETCEAIFEKVDVRTAEKRTS